MYSELERRLLVVVVGVRCDQVHHVGALRLIIVRLNQGECLVVDLVILVHLQRLDAVNTAAKFQFYRELVLPLVVAEVPFAA